MPRTSATDIASILRRDIENGVLREHDRLPAERELATKFGVARNTLREAILKLEEIGYVETRPSSGTYIVHKTAEPTSDVIENASPLELIDARFALEPHICRLSVLHGKRDQFQRLEELCETMEGSVENPQVFSQADTEFHRLLAETTGNGLLIWIISQINTVRQQDEWARVRSITLNKAIIEKYNSQHRNILNMIRSREPEAAAQAMKSHLESARLSLTRAAST